MTPSIEQWLTKAKETPSPNEVRMNLLHANPICLCLGESIF